MAGLRRTLPEELRQLVAEGRVAEAECLIARCEVGARFRDHDRPGALHLVDCPDELVRRLVERGEDVNAPNARGERPLHIRARRGGSSDQVSLLLSLGAEVDAPDNKGATPLHLAALSGDAETVEVLLAAGADPTACWKEKWENVQRSVITQAIIGAETRARPGMCLDSVVRIVERLLVLGARPTGAEAAPLRRQGRDYQRDVAHALRSGELPAELRLQGEALDRLYAMLGVEPVPPIRLHDGLSPIEVPDGPGGSVFSTLWDMLVPDFGRALTAQGEAIRITGRIGYELLNNGGVNWGEAYRRLAGGLVQLVGSGTRLPPPQWEDFRASVRAVADGVMDAAAIDRITDLVVEWVRLNPVPVLNPLPDLGR